MSTFEHIADHIEIEPSIELVDGMVRDLYFKHGLTHRDETPWLTKSPYPDEPSRHPDFYSQSKIRMINNTWIYIKFRREIGDSGYHYKTEAERYYLDEDTIYKDRVAIGRKGYRGKLEERARVVETDPEELYGFIVKHWPSDRSAALMRYYSGNTARIREEVFAAPSIQAARRGAYLMRCAERKHIGESPSFF